MTSHQHHHHNLAASMARWSSRHRKTAFWGWIAFVVVAFAVGNALGNKQISEVDQFTGESHQAEVALDRANLRPQSEVVFVQSDGQTIRDPGFQAAVTDVTGRLDGMRYVENLQSPLDGDTPVSEDGHAALVQFDIAGDSTEAKDRVDPILAQVAAAQKAHPDYAIEQFGSASANKAVNETIGDDLKKAGMLSIPVTLIILVVTFGTLVAASVPLLIGLTSVLAALGLVAFPSRILPVDDNLPAVILLIGLAVGVDYSLFYLRREREERAAGRSERSALEAAAATSGRAVLISGATVIVAMAGMFISGEKTFMAFAEGTILVVAIAMFASLTVLPAMLSWLGDRVENGRVPILGRRRRTGESRFWSVLVDGVMRRPVVAIVLAGGLLVALAIPALGMKSVTSGIEELPKDLPVIATYNEVRAVFPEEGVTATVVVEADDVRTGATAAAIAALGRETERSDLFLPGIEVTDSSDGTVAKIDVPTRGNGTDAASVAALDELRDRIVPATIGAGAGSERERHRRRSVLAGLRVEAQQQAAADLRVRLRARVRPDARDVPVDRHPDQGDRAQRALRRSRLRRSGPDLPERQPGVAAGIHLERRDHELAAALPVRRAVRALHGLPRVHPVPRP